MKSFVGICLLYLFISLPVNAASNVQNHSIDGLPLFETPTIRFMLRKQSPCFAIQTKSTIYTFSLAELFTFQFISLALAVSLLSLNINE
jgi:hypothetical protein